MLLFELILNLLKKCFSCCCTEVEQPEQPQPLAHNTHNTQNANIRGDEDGNHHNNHTYNVSGDGRVYIFSQTGGRRPDDELQPTVIRALTYK